MSLIVHFQSFTLVLPYQFGSWTEYKLQSISQGYSCCIGHCLFRSATFCWFNGKIHEYHYNTRTTWMNENDCCDVFLPTTFVSHSSGSMMSITWCLFYFFNPLLMWHRCNRPIKSYWNLLEIAIVSAKKISFLAPKPMCETIYLPIVSHSTIYRWHMAMILGHFTGTIS